MINRFKLYLKLGKSFLKNKVVTGEEYGEEYNNIAQTYNYWCEIMGKHVDKIIKSEYIIQKESPIIIDLACGTGYITRKILSNDFKGYIEGVDISRKMIEKCWDIEGDNVKFICKDAIKYLYERKEKAHAIYCGWALPYLDHREFLKSADKVLYNDGIIGVIANCKGTLEGIEKIYLEVMEENIDEVIKPMDARLRLPRGTGELERWFRKYNFYPLEIGEGEEIVRYDTPEELYDWLCKTGVLAGTNKIFKDMDKIHGAVVEKLRQRKYNRGKYIVNHKFVYGIFKKG